MARDEKRGEPRVVPALGGCGEARRGTVPIVVRWPTLGEKVEY